MPIAMLPPVFGANVVLVVVACAPGVVVVELAPSSLLSPHAAATSESHNVINSARAESTRSRNDRSRANWRWTLSTLWITVE
jgi:hypothetical protein